MIRPDGKEIELEVKDYVPYLCSKSPNATMSLAAMSPKPEAPTTRVKVLASSSSDGDVPEIVEEPYSPSAYDGEYEDDEPAIVGGNMYPADDDLVPDISGDPGADAPTDDERSAPAEPDVPDPPPDLVEERKRERGKAALQAEAKSKQKYGDSYRQESLL
eukprot:s659_g34.t1